MKSFRSVFSENKIVVLCALLACIKCFVFYTKMEANSNFFVLILLTVIISGMVFSLFRNKVIPAIIYFLFSCLMFADVTYYSYFGKYLSLKMLGSAEMLGDIKECIKEVIQPVNFVCILDAVLILVIVIIAVIMGKKNRPEGGDKQELIFRIVSIVLVFALILGLAPFSIFARSIRNQEFYSYHLYDIYDTYFTERAENLSAFEDSYKDEIDGDLFGIAEGRNMMFIQLESFMNFVIGREYNGQELTPNLNKLIKDQTIYCNHFYQQVASGNTSDAEFAANNSIYGTVLSYTNKIYGETNYFRGLPVLLKEKGYETAVFHAYQDKTFWNREAAYPNLGFDRYFGGMKHEGGDYEITEWLGWGLSDTEFLRQTVDLIEDNMHEPYYAFVNTLSNHHPFEMPEQYTFIELAPEQENTLVGHYLQSVCYVDYALGQYFDLLKERGLYYNTIFVIYGDHAGLTHEGNVDEEMKTLLGMDTYRDDYLLNVPCFIHIPGASKDVTRTVKKACGHLDILPTVAYLMGFDDLDTIYFGHNMLHDGYGLVPEQAQIKRGSFIYGNIVYKLALDGIFEHGTAWDIVTGKEVSLDGLYELYLKSMDIINGSEYVLSSDVLRTIYLDGGKLKELDGVRKRDAFPEIVVKAGYPATELVGCGNVAALDESYAAGYRNLALTFRWNEDGTEVYTVNENTDKNVMDSQDIIDWRIAHDDVNLVISVIGEKIVSMDNTYTFFGGLGEEGTITGRSFILWEDETSDYSGRHDAFLDVSKCEADNETLLNFIKINDVWAIIMTDEDSAGRRKDLLDAGCKVFIQYQDGTCKPYMV